MAKKASKKRFGKKLWLYLALGAIALLVVLAVILLISRQSSSSGTLVGEASKNCIKGTLSNNKICDGKKYISCTNQLKGKIYGDYACDGKKWTFKSIYLSCNTLTLQINMFGCKSNPQELFEVFCKGLLESSKAMNCP